MTVWDYNREKERAAEDVIAKKHADLRDMVFDERHDYYLLNQEFEKVKAELAALKAAHAWIKTSERMPSHGERCLVYADLAGTALCAIGQYIPYAESDVRPWRIHHGQDRFLYAGMASIVGWMPLPEAPK